METEKSTQHLPRVVDDEFDELLAALPAIVIEGARGVGKTRTALLRAKTVWRLDDPAERLLLQAAPARVLEGEPPILIDEWQRVPETWDLVRRAVDDGSGAGRFILTGSSGPVQMPTHSGAGRIAGVRMRPLSLAERVPGSATVSLRTLLTGDRGPLEGEAGWSLEQYVQAILSTGLPGLRGLAGRPLRAQIDAYLRRIAEHDIEEAGGPVRRPDTLMRWMRAYAAATATSTTFERIRDAATSDRGDKPAKTTTQSYTEALERLWILERLDAWLPTRNAIRRQSAPPKHHFVDPGLAARLLGADAGNLLQGKEPGPAIPRDGTLLGALFESLVTQSVRVYAQAAEAHVRHLRTYAGEHEIDLIVERADGRVVAIEVKMARSIHDEHVRQIHWLKERIGDDLLDAAVISTGPVAYRRSDGIAVIPASLLGP